MTASKPNDIFQPGDVLNNTYRIESILGRGGTSEVYKARSEISGRVMAVKALRAEFASNEDFLLLMTREEDIRDVRHDAIVRYFDTQRMPDGVVYLVMEHVDGPGLDQKLADGGMRANDLMIVGQRISEGLIAAHARNIVHRDLSPDNIILRNDIPAEAVIIDFGIAKDTNPGAETIVGNEFAGKYAYAAPEQLSGNTDTRSDIYSLGALLLSTFRGKKPDIGNNPMEVVQNKAKPLDVEGVPDPLRQLILKMCDPDPAKRFQSSVEMLAGFKNPASISGMATANGDASPMDDATVIMPTASRTASAPTKPETKRSPTPAPKKPAATAPAKKGGMLVPILGVTAVAMLGSGAYFGGLLDSVLGPKYPVADPYSLIIERTFDGDVRAVGNVPSPEVETALTTDITAMGGQSELTLATGDITDTWGDGLMQIVNSAAPLDEFRIAVMNNRVAVTGLAGDRVEQAAVEASFAAGFPDGFDGSINLGIGPRFLAPEAIEPLLSTYGDCGRLRLASPPPLGYGLEDRVIVTGRFANAANRTALENAIHDLAGDRTVLVEAEIFNQSLCKIDAILPTAMPGGFDLRFGYGDRPDQNLSGRYVVGENPVIDVKLPDGAKDGYLWVSVVDVDGLVFHLLPNRTRPDNGMATLREEAVDGYVRMAYGLAEAQENGRLAFNVDDTALGKSKVLVLSSDQPLFDELRPTTESVASYAEALQDAHDTGGLVVNSLDSAILTTEK